MDCQNNNPLIHTQETFRALVDAIVPRTPELAEEYGKIQFFGALDLHIDAYMILSLNHYYYTPLAKSTAEMLDTASDRLVLLNGNSGMLNYSRFPGGGTFAVLSPSDRFRALTLLKQSKIYPPDVTIPFQDDPGLVLSVAGAFNRFTMMGYYSEWPGYGSTRLEAPNQRKLEYFPLSWKQVGYPGPSLGYRALRK